MNIEVLEITNRKRQSVSKQESIQSELRCSRGSQGVRIVEACVPVDLQVLKTTQVVDDFATGDSGNGSGNEQVNEFEIDDSAAEQTRQCCGSKGIIRVDHLPRISFGVTLVSRFAALVAYLLLINASFIDSEAPFHGFVDDCIENAGRCFPFVPLFQKLRIEHLTHRVTSVSHQRTPEQEANTLFKVISESIKEEPQNLDLHHLRVFLCQGFAPYRQDEQKLLLVLRDYESLVQKGAKAEEWVGVAMLKAMCGQDWRPSLNRAKELGFKIPEDQVAGLSNWVAASLRDSSYSHPHLISWVEATEEITGDHELDILVARFYSNSGQYQKAIAEYSKIIKEGTEKEVVGMHYFRRAVCYFLLNDSDAARKDFRECLRHLATQKNYPGGGIEDFFVVAAKAALGQYTPNPDPRTFLSVDSSSVVLYHLLGADFEKALALGPHNGPLPEFESYSNGTSLSRFSGIPVLEQEANVHLLRAYAFEKLNKPEKSATELNYAFESIPATSR